MAGPPPTDLSGLNAFMALGGQGGGDSAGGVGGGQDMSDTFTPDDGGGGLGSISPLLMALTKAQFQGIGKDEPLTKEDKGLAMAQAGFAMAAGTSPHALSNIGQGALYGADALSKLKQQRALMRMKEMQGAVGSVAAMGLLGQRGSRTALNEQALGNNAAAKFTPERAQQVGDYIRQTGDIAGGLRMGGVGLIGNTNHGLVIDYLNSVGEGDMANKILRFKSAEAEAIQGGKVKAGPDVINTGAGQTTRAPPPLPTIPVPGATPPATGGVVAPPVVTAPPPPPAAAPSQFGPAAAPDDKRWGLVPVAPQPLSNKDATASSLPEAKKKSEDLGALYGEVNSAADAAKQTNYIYGNILGAAQHFPTGAGASTLNAANRILLSTARSINAGFDSIGVSPMDLSQLKDKVAGSEEFNKNVTNLVGANAKAVSPRASTQELMYLSGGVINENMTPQGMRVLAAGIMAPNDYALGKQRLMSVYQNRPGNTAKTLDGFDGWVNQNLDPAVFMLHRMSKEDAQTAIANLDKQPNGAAIKQNIARQMKFANDMGLFPEQPGG